MGSDAQDSMQVDQALSLHDDSLFDRVVLYAATALFASTIALATVQVAVRQFGLELFGLAHWTEPAARYVLIVATYLGAAVASRNGEHIKMEFLLDRLENRYPRARRVLDLLVAALVALFVAVALRGTAGSAAAGWETSIGGIGFVTAGTLYLGIACGLAVMLLYELGNLADRLRALGGEG